MWFVNRIIAHSEPRTDTNLHEEADHACHRTPKAMKPELRVDSQLVVRRGEQRDAELLAELGARTFAETFAADNTVENMTDYLASAFTPTKQAAELADRNCLFLIAESDRVAVGYALLRSERVPDSVSSARPIELVRLYVARENIGSGVGAALMQACIREARKLGYQTLWLGVWENNLSAQKFYRKWNFHEVGKHVFQLGDDPQTDLVLQRSLF